MLGFVYKKFLLGSPHFSEGHLHVIGTGFWLPSTRVYPGSWVTCAKPGSTSFVRNSIQSYSSKTYSTNSKQKVNSSTVRCSPKIFNILLSLLTVNILTSFYFLFSVLIHIIKCSNYQSQLNNYPNFSKNDVL